MNDSSTKSLMFQALFVLWFLIDLGHSNFFILSSKKIEKLNWNDFRKKNCKKLCKKIILGISDGWFMSHSSHQPSEPAYNIEDCRILDYVPSWLVLAEIKFLLHVSLPEWPINQFKLVQQIRQQGVRSYCPISKLCSRRPVPSTDQAIPSCFYFRISWILMEQRCFYFFCPLGFLQGLRSLKHWLFKKLSMKNLDQRFKFLNKK